MLFSSNQSKPNSKITLLIGPLIHRAEGQSMSFDLVVSAFASRGLPHKVIDIGTTNSSRPVGTFTLGRTAEILKVLTQYCRNLLCAERVYLLIGLSIFGFFRDLLIIWTAYIFKRRIVIHVHSGGYGTFFEMQSDIIKKLIVKTLIRVDAIVVLGHSLLEQFRFLPNADEKLYVVSNSIPFHLSIDSVIAKTLDHQEPVRLLYLSNLIESKGYLDCLEACRILHIERKIPVHFDFCGEFVQSRFASALRSRNESLNQFMNQIKTMGLANVALYHGVVSGIKKQRFLEKGHILILPTYFPWEGQPICIIEALTFSMPIIATHFRGIPEQIINNYNGLFVEPRNPVQIADCVEYMWNNPEKYNDMSLNARRHFDKNFSQKAHLERLIPIILGSQ